MFSALFAKSFRKLICPFLCRNTSLIALPVLIRIDVTILRPLFIKPPTAELHYGSHLLKCHTRIFVLMNVDRPAMDKPFLFQHILHDHVV